MSVTANVNGGFLKCHLNCNCNCRATRKFWSSQVKSTQSICNFCPHAAALLIKGPTKPILEGQQFTVECMYSDTEFNISQVHLEVFSKVRDKGIN